ncbi:Rho GDP-dissociation inhibitor [Entomortierella parvispora]|uniref:Rho GDP-dissociation inhibitor n=1 Tax=Entomortierella parvispora TaxID=205924 RepID=A0A9P3HMM1_9FUNG|nr:Rho GDP-dissociation inhibitor [Entomortierella parvispora]
MSQGHHNDDDDFGNNTGYKPGEKRSLAELNKLDADDESLARWKASLGVASSGVSKLEDPHNVVVLQLQLLVEGRPDVILDLTQSVEALKQHSFTIKEGVEYRLKVVFKVQHEVVSGLKYRQVVKRMGVTVDKSEEMIGSYAANPQTYEKKFAVEEAPSGMMARGHYEAKSKFIDDDGTIHKEWNWSFDIKKDW